MTLNCAYSADVIVERPVLLELKSVERILPVLRLSSCRVGLLMNFNSVTLKGRPAAVIW